MSEALAEGWVTILEAKTLTGYTAEYLRRLARRGHVEAQKVGGMWLVSRDNLLAYRSRMEALGRAKFDPRRQGGQEA